MFNRLKRFFVRFMLNKKPVWQKHSKEECLDILMGEEGKFRQGVHIKNRELTKEGVDLLKRRYNLWKQILHSHKS